LFVHCAGRDITLGGEFVVLVHAVDWISDDMQREDQVMLVDDGEPGARLGDGFLLPAPCAAS
jgi:hypothetical protein